MNLKIVFLLALVSPGCVSSVPFAHIRKRRVSGTEYGVDMDEDLDGHDDDYTAYGNYDYEFEGFVCSVGHEKIPLELLCDGVPDCSDGSDEVPSNCQERTDSTLAPSHSKTTPLTSATVKLTTQHLVEPELRKIVDYDDYTDCTADEFQCTSDQSICLPKYQLCDGIDDCPEKEDELGCLEYNPAVHSSPTAKYKPAEVQQAPVLNVSIGTDICSSTEAFQCRSQPSDCVPTQLLCDGFCDCKDGSDEERCFCGIGRYMCLNKRCVDASARCNGRNDCGDLSDEVLGCVIRLKINEDKSGEIKTVKQTTESGLANASVEDTTDDNNRTRTSAAQNSSLVTKTDIAEDDISVCSLHPCANSGRCIESGRSFYCICHPQYTGQTCLQDSFRFKDLDENSSHTPKTSNNTLLLSLVTSFILLRHRFC